MSELEMRDFPGHLTFTPVRWRCPKHGSTDRVLTFFTPTDKRTVCIHCLLELFERWGLDDLPRVD